MQVEFRGYGVDFIVVGTVELRGSRLSDMVNEVETVDLHDVALEGLGDMARVSVAQYSIRRDELLAIATAGPRGAKRRRVPTTGHRLQAQLGPYNVLGRLHTRHGGSVRRRFGSGGPMLPLTDATIAYVIGGILEVRDLPTILINRDLASWVRDEEADQLLLPWDEAAPARDGEVEAWIPDPWLPNRIAGRSTRSVSS
jgi:hypothetical protein